MKLNADAMPVDDLQTMLPALGVILPSGSKLQGGTLSVNVGIVGPVDKLVITGPIRLAQTKLQGFNLASKMSAISALSGAQTGSDTTIQNLSTDARVAPEGVRTQNINLAIPALGTVTGDGTISPGGALNYKMNASLSGSVVTGLTQLAGIGGKSGSVPFFTSGIHFGSGVMAWMKNGTLPLLPPMPASCVSPVTTAAGEAGVHFVIQRSAGADGSVSGDGAESRNSQVDVLRAHALGGDAGIGAQVLDGSVRASLCAGQCRDSGHLGSQIEALKFGLRQADRTQ